MTQFFFSIDTLFFFPQAKYATLLQFTSFAILLKILVIEFIAEYCKNSNLLIHGDFLLYDSSVKVYLMIISNCNCSTMPKSHQLSRLVIMVNNNYICILPILQKFSRQLTWYLSSLLYSQQTFEIG